MRPDRPDPAGVTWDDYLAAMAVVDRAVVFNIASPPSGDPDPLSAHLTGSVFEAPAREVNDNTAALVRAYPDKLIGFLSVHPRDPAMDDELDRATGDLGLRGIKLGPNYQNFDPPQRRGIPALRPARRSYGCRSCSTRAPRRSVSPISTMPTRGTLIASPCTIRSCELSWHTWGIPGKPIASR